MMVERGIDTIAMLVRKLLSLSTTDQGGEMADAGEAMDFVTQLLDAQFRRARVRMVREAAAQPAVLAMPRRELIQVLLNLMINARDAMSAGGTLTLGCRNDGEYGFLTIADTGAGIAPEILDRIFHAVLHHQGHQGHRPGPERGRVAGAVQWRRDTGQEQAGRGHHLYRTDTAGSKGTCMSEHILVVDDDELVRTGMAANLERSGFRVTMAASGEEGIRLALQQHMDLVLCDLVLGRCGWHRRAAAHQGPVSRHQRGHDHRPRLHQECPGRPAQRGQRLHPETSRSRRRWSTACAPCWTPSTCATP
jgi:CheY-like chemotaxis protein